MVKCLFFSHIMSRTTIVPELKEEILKEYVDMKMRTLPQYHQAVVDLIFEKLFSLDVTYDSWKKEISSSAQTKEAFRNAQQHSAVLEEKLGELELKINQKEQE